MGEQTLQGVRGSRCRSSCPNRSRTRWRTVLATVVPRATRYGWVLTGEGDDALRSETRAASRRRRSSETRSSVTKTLFARSMDDEGRVGTRARRGLGVERVARSSGRSRRATRRCLTARARAAARPPDGSLVQNEMGHRGWPNEARRLHPGKRRAERERARRPRSRSPSPRRSGRSGRPGWNTWSLGLLAAAISSPEAVDLVPAHDESQPPVKLTGRNELCSELHSRSRALNLWRQLVDPMFRNAVGISSSIEAFLRVHHLSSGADRSRHLLHRLACRLLGALGCKLCGPGLFQLRDRCTGAACPRTRG